MFLILSVISLSVALTNITPQQFTIFDEIGQMAAGMAHIHVAIPLNLTTFTDQADVLAEYLTKLTKVVELGKPEKESFMQGIRELAVFGLTRLNRMRRKIVHLDIILPLDGDLTTGRRNRRTSVTEDDEVVIDFESFSEVHHSIVMKNLDKTINIDDIFINKWTLTSKHENRIKERIKEVTRLHKTHSKTHKREKREMKFNGVKYSTLWPEENKTNTNNTQFQGKPEPQWFKITNCKTNVSHYIDRSKRYYAGPRETFKGSMFKSHSTEFGEERHGFEVQSLKILASQANATLFQIFEETQELIVIINQVTEKVHVSKQATNPATGIMNFLSMDLDKIEQDIQEEITQFTLRRKRSKRETD